MKNKNNKNEIKKCRRHPKEKKFNKKTKEERFCF
jgi:hypothetical protein